MSLDVMETTGANAREWGSLWGPGFDIPVAGMLSSGAAFYGTPVPRDSQGEGTMRRNAARRHDVLLVAGAGLAGS